MSRRGMYADSDHFDDWESFEMDDDIYAGVESGSDEWEDDGAIAEIRETPVATSDPVLIESEDAPEPSAEVFSILEATKSRRSSDLLELNGPSAQELLEIENVGIDEYIDSILEQEDEEETVDIDDSIEVVLEEETDMDDDIVSSDHEDIELVVMPLFEGVACALPTLFDEDGEVEYKATARLSRRLTDNGVDAIFLATADGEGFTLSRKERKNLVRSVIEGIDSHVIVDVSSPSIRQTTQITDDCVDAGATAVIVTITQATSDPYELISAIHDRHREVSIFVRLEGDMTSMPIAPEFLYDLPIVGVVDATGDAEYFVYLSSVYSGPLYVGTAHMAAYAHAMGASGVVLATTTVMSDVVERAFSGDADAQRELASWEREASDSRTQLIKTHLEEEFLVSSMMRR